MKIKENLAYIVIVIVLTLSTPALVYALVELIRWIGWG